MENEIPMEVLADWQNRTVKSIKNPRWANAEKTIVEADVVFEELEALGPIPFACSADADTPHGLLVWDAIVVKKRHGDIKPYDTSRHRADYQTAAIWGALGYTEAEDFEHILSQGPVRMRKMFEASTVVSTGTELYDFVRETLITAIGEKRAKEVLNQ